MRRILRILDALLWNPKNASLDMLVAIVLCLIGAYVVILIIEALTNI